MWVCGTAEEKKADIREMHNAVVSVERLCYNHCTVADKLDFVF